MSRYIFGERGTGINYKKSKAQVSIEFLILLIMGVFFVLTFIIIVRNLSDQKIQNKSINELDDLGKSIQQELLLASSLQDGYSRQIYIPPQLYGVPYTMNLSVASGTVMYLNFYHYDIELFYEIPYLQGDIKTGLNTISKNNNIITITQ